ncbi:MAG: phosphatase PAP2 family protein [Alphaproteobacteria bacterium]|nr:phosphatase PAP2 family protein [Alphaproteobacteria bacterium]
MQSDLAALLVPVISWDHAVSLWLNSYAGHTPALDRFVYNLADSAMLKGDLFMAFFWWLWFKRDDANTERRQTILTALAGAIIAIAVARLLQLMLPFRERPLHSDTLNLTPPTVVNPDTLDGWSSFPSDHAVLFFALALAVWRLHRTLGVFAILWAGIGICLPRVFLGYHYATDIIAGAVLGMIIMQAAFLLLRPRLLAQPLLRWEKAHATSFYCAAFITSLQLAVLFQDVRQLTVDSIGLVHHLTMTSAVATESGGVQ